MTVQKSQPEDFPTDDWKAQLYKSYVSDHAGISQDPQHIFSSEVLPHLPSDRSARVLDLGCGQGGMIHQLLEQGYLSAQGVDISREQVSLAHSSGLTNVVLADYRTWLPQQQPFNAVLTIDFLEHLERWELLPAMQAIRTALTPDGVLIARVPNAVSPLSGNYQYGDLTHETAFTAQSMRQLSLASGFKHVATYECRPVVHGIKSFARRLVWAGVSSAIKLALASETGRVRGHLVTQNLLAVVEA